MSTQRTRFLDLKRRQFLRTLFLSTFSRGDEEKKEVGAIDM